MPDYKRVFFVTKKKPLPEGKGLGSELFQHFGDEGARRWQDL